MKKVISFLAGDEGNFHFAMPVINYLKQFYEVKVCQGAKHTTEELKRILNESDVVWYEWGNGPVLEASHLPKKAKTILRVHRYEILGNEIGKINWENIDNLIFVNEDFYFLFKELVNKRIDEETKVSIIPNPVSERGEYADRKPGYNIAYVSRFNPDKNPALMIQVLKKLVDKDTRYKVYMAGGVQDAQLYLYCIHLINELGLQNNFIYEGKIDNIPQWLSNKNYFLSTSIVESQGVAISEAMMLGIKPVLHNSFGNLGKIFDKKFLFNTPGEAAALITENEYNSVYYRKLVLDRYSDRVVLPKIKSLVEKNIGETNSVKVETNTNEYPFVTIGILTCNRAGFLPEAIESALNQEGNYEVVVVDDASSDDTKKVVEKYESGKVRYFKNDKNLGRPKTRNRIIKEARGEYILWLGDDDILVEGTLKEYSEIIRNKPETDVIYANVQAFNHETGSELALYSAKDYTNSTNNMLADFISGSGITDGGSLVRKSLYDKYGYYDEEYLRAQDNEFWTRLAGRVKFYKLNRVVYHYRKHSNNISMNDFIDRSYESQTIRNIVASNSLEKIYPALNWSNQTQARDEALYEIAKGLTLFGDHFNTIKVLNRIENKSPEFLLLLFRAYLKSGDKAQAESIIKSVNGELKIKLNEIFNKYEKLWTLNNEKDFTAVKYALENFIKSEGYSFFPAVIIGKIFESIGDNNSAYQHMKNAVFYNPANEETYVQALNTARKAGKEEDLISMRARVTKEIFFFEDKKKSGDELVSVIIPSFNRPEKLKNAIDSVLSQTHKNLELIIVKDGGKSINKIIKSFKDKRIKLIDFNNNRGPSAARNAGIKSAKGKYIALLDDDDIFYPDHLETALNYLNGDIKVVYTDAVRSSYVKDGESYKLQNQTVPYSIDYNRNKLLVGNISPVNCFVFEKSLLDKAGLFDESLQVLEDWEFWLRLSEIAEFKHIKKNTVQVNWYNDGTTLTSSKQEEFGRARKLIYKKYENEINAIPDMNKIVEEFNAIWRKDNQAETPLVSIIALTYNQLEYTKAFIESVYKFTDVPFEIILVDNNSSDETKQYLSELAGLHGNVKVILNKENMGFPKGINQGIKASSGRYILIANNDILVTGNWLKRMIEVAESDPAVGIVGPISNAVSGVQIDKDAKYTTVEEMFTYSQKVRKENAGKMFVFPRVAFLCTLIKKEVIEKIGGLDERFSPGNFEDDDFCLRAQLAGYKTAIAQDVFIHHFGSKSFTAEGLEKYQERLDKNKKIFIEKWDADPEDIWLRGKSIKQRSTMYTINSNDFVEAIERAKIQINDQEYSIALNSLITALNIFDEQSVADLNINKTDLLILTGNVAMLSNQIDTASECFESALNMNPQSPEACLGLGEIFYKKNMPEQAKTMFEWSVYFKPDYPKAIQMLQEVNSKLGFNKDNNSLFGHNQNHQTAGDNAEQLLSKAAELLLKQRFEEAKTAIESAEGLFNGQLSNPVNPEFASTFYNLKGYIFLGMDDNDTAKEYFEKSLNLNPKSSQACTGLAEVILLEGLQKSKVMFEWGVKNNSSNILATEGLKKVNNLLGLPDNNMSENPNSSNEISVVELLDNAYRYFEQQNYTEALRALTAAEELLPENDMKIKSAVESLKGFSYLGLDNLEDARNFFERALNDEPDSSDACAGLAEVFRLTGLDKEAKTMYEWALLYNPGNKFAVSGLAKVNSLLGLENHHNSLIQEYQ